MFSKLSHRLRHGSAGGQVLTPTRRNRAKSVWGGARGPGRPCAAASERIAPRCEAWAAPTHALLSRRWLRNAQPAAEKCSAGTQPAAEKLLSRVQTAAENISASRVRISQPG